MNPFIDENGYLVFTVDENECNDQGCLVCHTPSYINKRYKVNTNTGLFEEVV